MNPISKVYFSLIDSITEDDEVIFGINLDNVPLNSVIIYSDNLAFQKTRLNNIQDFDWDCIGNIKYIKDTKIARKLYKDKIIAEKSGYIIVKE